jgi:hypothetical protein
VVSPAGLVRADPAVNPDWQIVTALWWRSSLLRRLCEAPALYLLTSKMGLLLCPRGWQEALPGEEACPTFGVAAFRSRPEGTEQLPISREVNHV